MLRAIFQRVFGWTMLVCSATGAGLASIAPDYAMLMLGGQWSGVERLVPWLALAASAACVTNTADPVFDSLGRPNWSARLQWLRLCMLAVAVAVAAVLWRSLEAMAIVRLIVVLGSAPLFLALIARAVRFPVSVYLALAWRPIVAAVAMSVTVLAIARLMPGALGWRLVLQVSLGAAVYGSVLMSLWIVTARPDGAETDIVSTARLCMQWSRRQTLKLMSTVL
jgi:O-antigen/teichoic acid export membrane protein